MYSNRYIKGFTLMFIKEAKIIKSRFQFTKNKKWKNSEKKKNKIKENEDKYIK